MRSLVMEWISVEKKLPEVEATVLVTTGRHITLADWMAEGQRFAMTSREDAVAIPVASITHWMPLPELPKERHNDWDIELLLRDGVTVESHLDMCPVEYSGRVDDKAYYFRSRGRCWEMTIAETVDAAVEAALSGDPLETSVFHCAGHYGNDQYAAGYVPLEQAEEIIRRCVKLWRSAQEEKAGKS
jgi:hypothetical protein